MSILKELLCICEKSKTPDDAAKQLGLPDGWTVIASGKDTIDGAYHISFKIWEPGVSAPLRSIPTLLQRFADLGKAPPTFFAGVGATKGFPHSILRLSTEAATPEEAAQLAGLPKGWKLTAKEMKRTRSNNNTETSVKWSAKEPGVWTAYSSVTSLRQRLGFDLPEFFRGPTIQRQEPAADFGKDAVGATSKAASVHCGPLAKVGSKTYFSQ